MVEMTWNVRRDESGRRVLQATWLSAVPASRPLPLAG